MSSSFMAFGWVSDYQLNKIRFQILESQVQTLASEVRRLRAQRNALLAQVADAERAKEDLANCPWPHYSENSTLAKLSEHIADQYITQKAFAKAHGVSESFVRAVIAGKQAMSPWMLAQIGLERKFVYAHKTTA